MEGISNRNDDKALALMILILNPGPNHAIFLFLLADGTCSGEEGTLNPINTSLF